jgi:hypothetical protein
MGVLAPWFLAGLAAIGLPIWLHLLQQHRVDPVKFPSLQLFERRTETSVRQRRLKYKLLMALRILMFVLLALLFAQPFVRRDVAALVSAQHHLIVVDNSFSMRSGNRVERAKSEAQSFADGLPANATAQVVTLGGGANLLTQATPDKAELRSAIASIAPSGSRSAFAEVARTARTIAEARNTPIEVHLFSDLQRTSMPGAFAEMGMPSGAKLTVHDVGGKDTPNFAIENVNAPQVIADTKNVRLTATVRGFATEQSTQRVAVALNGRVLDTKTVTVPADGRATVEFTGLDANYGWNRGEVRLEGSDALAEDNVMRFAVERADPRKVLFLHEPGRTRSALYFRAALEAASAGLFTLEPVPVEQAAGLDPARYAFVVLSDVGSIPAAFDAKLREFVKTGGGVWIAAGPTTAARGAVPFTGAKIAQSLYAARSAERFYSAAKLDLAHPSVGRANRWEGVRFYQASEIGPPEGAETVARLSNGSPLLIETREGEGRVLTFASGLENVSNDFPLHSAFVPFVEQTSRYLARLDTQAPTLLVDSFLELRKTRGEGAGGIDVLDPRGNRVLELNRASSAQTVRVTEEGFYEINRGNNRRELVAVNADRAESDLRRMPEESIEAWKLSGDGAPEPLAVGGAPERKPVSLWWWVALALLIAAFAEALAGARHFEPESAG